MAARKKKQAKLEGIGYDSLAEEDEETQEEPSSEP